MKSRSRPAGWSRRAESLRRAGAAAGARAGRARPGGALSAWLATLLRHPALWSGLLAAALYLPALSAGFVRDDHELVEANAFLRDTGHLGRLMVSDFWEQAGGVSGLWRPLVTLSYWLNGRLGDWQPGPFHAANLLAHAAATALMVGLMLAGGAPRAAAWIGGLWFAAMPAHVESVAWIAGRSDLLCAGFLFAALALDRRARGARRAWPGWGPMVLLAAALLSKEAAAPFVALVAVAEWTEPGPPRGAREMLAWLAPYLAVTVVWMAVHVVVAPGGEGALDPATLERGRWTGWLALPAFLGFLWPGYPHTPDFTPALPPAHWAPAAVGGAVLHLMLGGTLVLLLRRRARAALPLALFWLALLPLVGLALVRGFVATSERVVYLPSAGAAWALGLAVTAPALARWRPAAGAAWVAAAALVVASAAVTLRLLPTWRDDGAMFRAMIATQPHNPVGFIGWAGILAERGREPEARELLRRAETLDPRRPEIHLARAAMGFRHADWGDVLAEARATLALDPRQRDAQVFEATALVRLRRFEEAEAALRAMLARRPGDPDVAAVWGQYLLLAGRLGEALPYLEHAARWKTDDASLEYALGVASDALGRPAQARAAFERTLALDPRYYDGWLRLARACHELGDAAARDAALERAARLPESGDGRVARLRAEFGGSAP